MIVRRVKQSDFGFQAFNWRCIRPALGLENLARLHFSFANFCAPPIGEKEMAKDRWSRLNLSTHLFTCPSILQLPTAKYRMIPTQCDTATCQPLITLSHLLISCLPTWLCLLPGGRNIDFMSALLWRSTTAQLPDIVHRRIETLPFRDRTTGVEDKTASSVSAILPSVKSPRELITLSGVATWATCFFPVRRSVPTLGAGKVWSVNCGKPHA